MGATELGDELTKLRKDIANKKKEIDKRREVIETVSTTYVARKKDEAKIEAIDTKITAKVATIDKTIEYYKTEIEKAQTKSNDDLTTFDKKMQDEIIIIRQKAELEIERIQKKYDTEKKKVEDKFNNYRMYCMQSIAASEEKRNVITEPLEKRKEAIEATMDKSEDDDKILVRLKVELKQMLDEEKEKHERWIVLDKEERDNRLRQAEAEKREQEEKLRFEEAVKRQRDLELYLVQKEQEKVADEERWQRRREQEKADKLKQEALQREKEELQLNKKKFETEIFPNLSETAANIYTFFKGSIDSNIYKSAKRCKTLEECEEFLLQYEDTFITLSTFEEGKYKQLSRDDQDKYDELSSIEEQLRHIKKLEKKKPEPKKKSSTVIPLSQINHHLK